MQLAPACVCASIRRWLRVHPANSVAAFPTLSRSRAGPDRKLVKTPLSPGSSSSAGELIVQGTRCPEPFSDDCLLTFPLGARGCVSNYLRWQTIADHNEWPNRMQQFRRFPFPTRPYDVTRPKLLRSNKFIIYFAWVMLKYTWNWENIAILGNQEVLEEVKLVRKQIGYIRVSAFANTTDIVVTREKMFGWTTLCKVFGIKKKKKIACFHPSSL